MSTFHTYPKRHAVKRRDHGVLAWTLALIAGALVFVPSYFWFSLTGALDQVESHDVTLLLGPDRPAPPPVPTDAEKGQWINILLMGSDARTGANLGIGGDTGGGEYEMNNDTAILMHISADRTRIELVSFPRDLMVQIPGCDYSDGSKTYRERAQFNKAFLIGGMHGILSDAAACTQKTVESITGLFISEYVVVDFVGVESIIDLLGGVPMCVPFSFTSMGSSSTDVGLHFDSGRQIFSGAQALSWARTRYFRLDDPANKAAWENLYGGGNGSDVPRIKRQQEMVGKVLEVAVESNLFIHPAQLTSLLEAAALSMTVSPRMKDARFLVGLAWSLQHIDKAKIVFTTVPTKGDPTNKNHLVFIEKESDALFAALAADQPIAGTSVAGMSTAGPVPAPTVSSGTAPGTDTGTGSDDEIDLLAACTAG
jgi:LCP family protein required for cell wall assembly